MDKCFIITGAGSGIGRAAAVALANASNNHIVMLIGRREGPLYDTVALTNHPSRHIVAPADIREQGQLTKLAEEHKLSEKALSGIFVNAGVGGENQAGSTDRWFDIINTNLTGSYNTVQAFLPYLKSSQADKKSILFTASILAKIGVPGYQAYCASKAGILGLMRSLAQELAPENIAVNALCPGWVETDMATDGLKAFAEKAGQDYERILKLQMQQVPFGRMSDPKEIAEWVSFLFTADQQSLTGQSLDINNGAFMS